MINKARTGFGNICTDHINFRKGLQSYPVEQKLLKTQAPRFSARGHKQTIHKKSADLQQTLTQKTVLI
jgi:hypothetical protein